MKYTSADGHEYADEDVQRWCEDYERGEFPEGEHSTGKIVYGRPPRTDAHTTTLTVKVPVGLKKAIAAKAKQEGVTTSALVRQQLVQANI